MSAPLDTLISRYGYTYFDRHIPVDTYLQLTGVLRTIPQVAIRTISLQHILFFTMLIESNKVYTIFHVFSIMFTFDTDTHPQTIIERGSFPTSPCSKT